MQSRQEGRTSIANAVAIQRSHYRDTAGRYDETHAGADGEHEFALAFMLSTMGLLRIESLLDVGSGTGRALLGAKRAYPNLSVMGIEPSPELRAIGHGKGLSEAELVDGDAQRMSFADGSFDIVCEFGALHHIPDPHQAVSEMLRVASKAIFISDNNNFGAGSALGRAAKQVARAMGLWKLIDFAKTGGKGYTFDPLGDGLAYSYSVFSDYNQIARRCRSVHLLNTVPSGINLYRSAANVALLGIK